MKTTQTLSCACGAMHWQLSAAVPGRHVVCYCVDCQSFARHLGRTDLFGSYNGTHLWQTVPEGFEITAGTENLRALRLSSRGLYRWYAGCCGTPIANTLAKPTLPFVGAILPAPGDGFGKPMAHVHTHTTKGAVKQRGFEAAGATLMLRAIGALIRRQTRGSFFDAGGQPMREPKVLTLEERSAARSASG